jgi:hypothetical protein
MNIGRRRDYSFAIKHHLFVLSYSTELSLSMHNRCKVGRSFHSHNPPFPSTHATHTRSLLDKSPIGLLSFGSETPLKQSHQKLRWRVLENWRGIPYKFRHLWAKRQRPSLLHCEKGPVQSNAANSLAWHFIWTSTRKRSTANPFYHRWNAMAG